MTAAVVSLRGASFFRTSLQIWVRLQWVSLPLTLLLILRCFTCLLLSINVFYSILYSTLLLCSLVAAVYGECKLLLPITVE